METPGGIRVKLFNGQTFDRCASAWATVVQIGLFLFDLNANGRVSEEVETIGICYLPPPL